MTVSNTVAAFVMRGVTSDGVSRKCQIDPSLCHTYNPSGMVRKVGLFMTDEIAARARRQQYPLGENHTVAPGGLMKPRGTRSPRGCSSGHADIVVGLRVAVVVTASICGFC